MLAQAERRPLSWAADYQAAVYDVQLDAEVHPALNHALRFRVSHGRASGLSHGHVAG
jgi:hypothetical protein